MVGKQGGAAFSNIHSTTVSSCFIKPAPVSWSRASWPFRGITGFSERKVAGAGIFCLYLGIWSGYVERGSMIFGKGLSNPSSIKHSLSSCFSVRGTGHINISQSWPLFLKGSCFSGIDRLVYSKQSSSMLCFDQKYEKVSWGPPKRKRFYLREKGQDNFAQRSLNWFFKENISLRREHGGGENSVREDRGTRQELEIFGDY